MTNKKIHIEPQQELPHNEETERKVISYLCTSTLQQVQETLEFGLCEDCFYNSKHREIFNAITRLVAEGETPNIMNVSIKVQSQGENVTIPDIVDINADRFVSAIQVYQSGGIPILIDMMIKRRVWSIVKRIETSCFNLGEDMNNTIDGAIQELKEARGTGTGQDTISMQEVLKDVCKIVQNNLNGENVKSSSKTGFSFLDEKGGFRGGNLIVVAGATSMGKTSFADSIVLNAITTGTRIAFYSLEMTKEELTARLISCCTNVNSNKMLNGVLNKTELAQFDKGLGDMWELSNNLYFDHNSSASIDNIINSIRKQKAKNNISGVVVDFIQRLHGADKGQTKEQFMGTCAQRLKDIAIELDIWVMVLSQVNRDPNNPLPSLDRLRDSGQIAEACDISIMIYRPQYYNEREGKKISYPHPYENVSTQGTAMIVIQKGRNIGTGSFICGFNATTTHFYELQSLPTIAQGEVQPNKDIIPF